MLLYVISSHQKQLRSLIRNPVRYIKKCQGLPVLAKHEFKLNPTLTTLKSWCASETVTTESKPTAITSSHRTNLLAHLGSEKTGKSKAQKPRSPTLSSSLSSSDEEPPPPKKSQQKRKAPELKLSDDDLGGQPGPSSAPEWSPQHKHAKLLNIYQPKKQKEKRIVH